MTARAPAAFPFTIGVVFEEIGADPVEVARVAGELGFTSIELNPLTGTPSDWWDDARIDRTADILAAAGLPVLAFDLPIFKAEILPDDAGGFARSAEYAAHLATLDRALVLRNRFRGPAGGPVPFVRTFTFRRPDGGVLPTGAQIPDRELDLVVAGLRPAVERAAGAGATLVLENVRSCWGNTGANAARIIERVGSPSFRAIWDPANAYVSGESFPAGWRAICSHVAHVHLKDAAFVDRTTGLSRWERIGAGGSRIIDELRALRDLPYHGAVHVETHWKPDDGGNGTPATRAGLANLLASLAKER